MGINSGYNHKLVKTKKAFPILLSFLAIASIASTAILGNTQTAYAGNGGCTVNPNELDFGTFASDVFVTIPKTVTCFEGVTGVRANPSDCLDKGILVSFENAGINQLVWTADEIIGTNAPDGIEVHCAVEFTVFDGFDNTSIIFQDIWLIPDDFIVGGEFLSIDSTALLLAGLQSSAIWMLPVLAGAAGVGAYYIKTRMNKE